MLFIELSRLTYMVKSVGVTSCLSSGELYPAVPHGALALTRDVTNV